MSLLGNILHRVAQRAGLAGPRASTNDAQPQAGFGSVIRSLGEHFSSNVFQAGGQAGPSRAASAGSSFDSEEEALRRDVSANLAAAEQLDPMPRRVMPGRPTEPAPAYEPRRLALGAPRAVPLSRKAQAPAAASSGALVAEREPRVDREAPPPVPAPQPTPAGPSRAEVLFVDRSSATVGGDTIDWALWAARKRGEREEAPPSQATAAPAAERGAANIDPPASAASSGAPVAATEPRLDREAPAPVPPAQPTRAAESPTAEGVRGHGSAPRRAVTSPGTSATASTGASEDPSSKGVRGQSSAPRRAVTSPDASATASTGASEAPSRSVASPRAAGWDLLAPERPPRFILKYGVIEHATHKQPRFELGQGSEPSGKKIELQFDRSSFHDADGVKKPILRVEALVFEQKAGENVPDLSEFTAHPMRALEAGSPTARAFTIDPKSETVAVHYAFRLTVGEGPNGEAGGQRSAIESQPKPFVRLVA